MNAPSDILRELQTNCTEIENEIWANYIDPTENCEPIIDGIVHPETYLTSALKILWILKEPYDETENGVVTGGGWHFANDFLYPDGFYSRMGRSRNTWYPIIYVCYGLLNNYMLWNDMDDISKNQSMTQIVRHIAVINVRKLPGFTRTYNYNSIIEAFHQYKAILLKQISTYNPDIIIGGSTLPLFYEDLGVHKEKDEHKFGCTEYVVMDRKLLISAYHPAQTQVKREDYVNDIINLVKTFRAGLL